MKHIPILMRCLITLTVLGMIVWETVHSGAALDSWTQSALMIVSGFWRK